MLRLTKCKSSHSGVRQIRDGSANLWLLNTTNQMWFQLRKFLKHCSPEAERLCQGKYLFYIGLVFNPLSIASVTGKQAPRLNRPLVWFMIVVHLHDVHHFPWENHFKHLHSCCQRKLRVAGAHPAFWDSNDYMVGSGGMCSSAVSSWP